MRRDVALAGLAAVCAACLVAIGAVAQQAHSPREQSITTKELPVTGLWNFYSASLDPGAGSENLTWRLVKGGLPRGLKLREHGRIEGTVNQEGTFDVWAVAVGRGGAASRPKRFTLKVEDPLRADWSRKSQVNGNRIEGSIKVSNTTGRDFDLTFVVLAVNDVGRATAIGYQRFPLKKNTRDMELPFGETLAAGDYVVNIDLVAEEPQSRMIFRARMVTPKQTIAPVL